MLVNGVSEILDIKLYPQEVRKFGGISSNGEEGDVNLVDEDGRSALHYAYMNFKRSANSLVSILIEKNAKTDIKDKFGKIPSEYANISELIPLPKVEALDESSKRPSLITLEGPYIDFFEKVVAVNSGEIPDGDDDIL